GVMHDCRARVQRHVLAAGIDEVQILLARPGQRAIADDPVLGMEDDRLVTEIEIRAQGRDADPEIDDPAVLKLHRQPVAHLLAGQAFRAVAHRTPLDRSARSSCSRYAEDIASKCPTMRRASSSSWLA